MTDRSVGPALTTLGPVHRSSGKGGGLNCTVHRSIEQVAASIGQRVRYSATFPEAVRQGLAGRPDRGDIDRCYAAPHRTNPSGAPSASTNPRRPAARARPRRRQSHPRGVSSACTIASAAGAAVGRLDGAAPGTSATHAPSGSTMMLVCSRSTSSAGVVVPSCRHVGAVRERVAGARGVRRADREQPAS
jgi:hypothetical protein